MFLLKMYSLPEVRANTLISGLSFFFISLYLDLIILKYERLQVLKLFGYATYMLQIGS